MMGLQVVVVLDFACCLCQQSVSVTVKCAGKGLTAGSQAVAAVKVPCPNCGSVNQLYFEPSGTVRAVSPCPTTRPVPEPSLN
jgi:hypothetical protein